MKNILLLCIIICLYSCGTASTIDDFNKEEWIDDANGCKSMRDKQVSIVIDHKTELMGLTDREIFEILGQPDETNLYQRTQRFLVYFTTPGPNCDSTYKNPSRLEIRISALNTSNEITYYP